MLDDQVAPTDSAPVMRLLPPISGGSDADLGEAAAAGAPPTGADPAPTAEGQPPAPEPQPPFHQHPRFQQLIGENRTLRATVQTLGQRLQSIETKAAQQGGQLSPEDRFKYQQAAGALKQLLAEDPELKSLLDIAKQAPKLLQGYEGVEHLTAAQQATQHRAASDHIKQLAQAAGMSQDPKFLQHLVPMVARAARGLPDADHRYDSGDFTVLDEAFESVKPYFQQRQAARNLLDTKHNVQRLPLPAKGGAPGHAAMPQIGQNGANARTVRAWMRDQAGRFMPGTAEG